MARQSDGAWYRGAKDCWYATVGGRQVSLGVRGKKNRKAAQDAWHRLLANGAVPAVKPAPEATPPGLRRLVNAFLADIGDRAKPKTVAVYRYFLDAFVANFGGRRADTLTPHEVEAFARKPSWSASTRHDFLGTLVTAFRWA